MTRFDRVLSEERIMDAILHVIGNFDKLAESLITGNDHLIRNPIEARVEKPLEMVLQQVASTDPISLEADDAYVWDTWHYLQERLKFEAVVQPHATIKGLLEIIRTLALPDDFKDKENMVRKLQGRTPLAENQAQSAPPDDPAEAHKRWTTGFVVAKVHIVGTPDSNDGSGLVAGSRYLNFYYNKVEWICRPDYAQRYETYEAADAAMKQLPYGNVYSIAKFSFPPVPKESVVTD